ncbi:methionyl-tRNA formyltransferase [Capillimicrobium parvum]|uniref:Methionyl-tRNA formyltransferase n=1 Tax=Capillimicrobium parvum TaxID=2884022 RepID=A0A9E7C0N7_9ACTN|nr:methionyl-tRNA formyltransferase [Capillimicrobium parvum]UGS35804.1 Methionyl-tRNA formyltransferase [Capillimicrobium parvum]
MRLAYLGTSAFAASVLERLAAGGRAPELVVTRPDAPRGRGRRLAPPPVADTARELGLEVHQPEQVSDDPRVVDAGFEAIVVCAYGALLREPLLSHPGLLNIHPSLLPRWRGAAPIERAIMAGDAQTGVAIMRPTEGFDEGPVCAVQSEPIRPDDDYGTLSARLETLGAQLLGQVLEERPPCVEQTSEGIVYAEKIGPRDRLLDPARPAAELERVVRALHPHIGARLALAGGQFLGVRRARVVEDPADGVQAADGRLLVGTVDGSLELLEVQPPGGRPMDARAYLRGRSG